MQSDQLFEKQSTERHNGDGLIGFFEVEQK